MLSKTQIKYIRSLTQQKYRKEHKAFIAEGDKIAKEWLMSDQYIEFIVARADWLSEYASLVNMHDEATVVEIQPTELERVSALKTPNQVLLVVKMPKTIKKLPEEGWVISLSTIQDPGNMGTIIRIADWFGVEHIVCSPDCVDWFNPKVVQAAMGGHLRVQLHTAELDVFLKETKLPVFAATLEGENIHEIAHESGGVILIGNESKGLSNELIALTDHQVTIPKNGGAESLNAAVSTGILTAILTQR